MIFQFGKYKIDADVERTRKYYQESSLITQSCQCEGCRNFELAVEKLPDSVNDFFASLGIDLKKVFEAIETGKDGGYWGIAYLYAEVLEGENPHIKTGENSFRWNEEAEFSVGDIFFVTFENEKADDSVEPNCTLEFYAKIPWVLQETKNKDFSLVISVDKEGIAFLNGEKVLFADCKRAYNSGKCIGEREIFWQNRRTLNSLQNLMSVLYSRKKICSLRKEKLKNNSVNFKKRLRYWDIRQWI